MAINFVCTNCRKPIGTVEGGAVVTNLPAVIKGDRTEITCPCGYVNRILGGLIKLSKKVQKPQSKVEMPKMEEPKVGVGKEEVFFEDKKEIKKEVKDKI